MGFFSEVLVFIQSGDVTMWEFPKMVVPPKHPKNVFLVGKTMVVGYHLFRKHPYIYNIYIPHISILTEARVSILMWTHGGTSSQQNTTQSAFEKLARFFLPGGAGRSAG